MKIKNLILTLFAVTCLFNFNVKSADSTFDITTATASNLISGPLQMTQLEIINNHPTNAVVVKIYDAPSNLVLWTNGAFTNFLFYTTNLITYSTSYYNVITTNTNRVQYQYPNAVAAAGRSYKLLKSVTVAVGASYVWTPIGGVYFSYGLLATNTQTNVTYNIEWSQIVP